LKDVTLNNVVSTIYSIMQENGKEIFQEDRLGDLMNLIRSKVEPGSDTMRFIIDLVNKDYFIKYSLDDYEANQIAENVLDANEATDEQKKAYFEAFAVPPDAVKKEPAKAPVEETPVEEDDAAEEETETEAPVEEEPEQEQEEPVAEEETVEQPAEEPVVEEKPEVTEDEQPAEESVAEEKPEVTEEEQTAEETPEEENVEDDDVEDDDIEDDDVEDDDEDTDSDSDDEEYDDDDEDDDDGKPGFFSGLFSSIFENKGFFSGFAAAIILLIISAIFIKPETNDKFYLCYYIIFILFSIGVLFCCLMAQSNVNTLRRFFKAFKSSKGRVEDLVSDDKNLKKIVEAYKGSFLQNSTIHKTRSNADLYFGGETYFQDMNRMPVQRFLKIIPGTFIGFGILGTFIGFAGGLSSINIADSQSLLDGVQELLNGLRSAFNTSIIGVLASMFLNFVLIHPLFNKFDRVSKEVCDYLDNKFFVSEIDAMSVVDADNNLVPFPQTMGIVLDKLEQVASNVNNMGAIVGDQVTQSVKETLDKTIEKIIVEEIKKLKVEINTSIDLLKECESHLQNAPVHIKEAAEKMRAAAISNDELFRKENQESVDALMQSIDRNVTDKFASYTKAVEATSEQILSVKNSLELIPQEFSSVETSVRSTSQYFSMYAEQTTKLNEMMEKFNYCIESYSKTSAETKAILAGFMSMDERLSTVFDRINENTKNYSEIVGESLNRYFEGFADATKDITLKFTDATTSLSEEIEKLNKKLN